jgi:hypothetical protein
MRMPLGSRVGSRILVSSIAGVTALGLVFAAAAAVEDPDDLADVAENVPGVIEHCDEAVADGEFIEIFECGDALFDTEFNAVDGVGASVGTGQRFTRTPRFDLDRYADIQPTRLTGPNSSACSHCHPGVPLGGGGDGSGIAALNNVQDFAALRGSADPNDFVQRNPVHLFAPGALQLAAEEMTRDLAAIRTRAVQSACSQNQPVTAPLASKGISFGSITASPMGCPNGSVDTSAAEGVDADLVVKPFGWKGIVAPLRLFNAAAFHNELGMTPTEFSGPDVDSDFDGVRNEILIEDVSAMTIYLAAQPRPTTLVELDDLRRLLLRFGRAGRQQVEELGIPALTSAQRTQIARGQARFAEIGCALCHRPSLELDGKTFAEPSSNPAFTFDLGVDPRVADLVDPQNPLTFDVTRDQPDNVIQIGNRVIRRLGSLETNAAGKVIVRSFGDLKRHEMGPRLAETIANPVPGTSFVVPTSVFLTTELWGLGSTAPYLHDGRASTIEEAIIEHGGEAQASRDRFRALDKANQDDVLAFLNNLVLFFPAEEE